jgi:hypothetical protein
VRVCSDSARFRIGSSRPLGRALGIFAAALWLGQVSAAHAASGTHVALDYAPNQTLGCMDGDDLRRAVAGQLAYDPFRTDAEIEIAVHVVKAAANWEGRIEWRRAGGRLLGERLVQSGGRDCGDVMAKVAFAIVVQIQLIDLGAQTAAATDASAAGRADAPQAPAPVEKSPPLAPRENSVAAFKSSSDADEPRMARPVKLALGIGPLLGIGLTPKVAGAGRVFAALRTGRWSVELAADAALPATRRQPDSSGIVVNAAGTSLGGCARWSVVVSCLVGRLGWLHARGEGIDAPNAGSAYFGQLGLRLGSSKDVGRFLLGVHAEGLVMLSDWDVIQNGVTLWTVPRIGAFFGADAGFAIF